LGPEKKFGIGVCDLSERINRGLKNFQFGVSYNQATRRRSE
jgi:hypothetical protein